MRTVWIATLLCAAPIAAQPAATSPAAASPYAALAGVVIDSIHGGALLGAMVVVSGTDRSATVDSTGRFRIDSIPPGDHELGVFHPLLDSLSISISSKNVALPAGLVTTVIMATPSAPTVVSAYCSEEERKRGMGTVIGRVLAVESDDPVKDVTVRYTSLSAIYANGRQIKRDVLTREVKTKPTGDFALCGLPIVTGGTVRAAHGDITTGEMVADVSKWLIASVTLRLDTLKRGTAVVLGRIVDDKGKPLPRADVSLAGSRLKTVTGDSGTFALRDLPAGSQTIEVRKVGFAATDTALMLSSKSPVQFDMTLRAAPVTLSTVNINALREAALVRVGFEDRRKRGIGRYLTEDQVKNRGAMQLSDLMRMMPGFIVRQTRFGQVILQGRGQSMMNRGCVVYLVDRMPIPDRPLGSIDSFVKPDDIIGLEVYNPAEAPADLVGAPMSCSVVVIWTRATSNGN
jgi:hypothetical protein